MRPMDALVDRIARTRTTFRLIAQAIDADVEALLDQHTTRRTPEGRTGVVRNGYLPEREVQIG